MKKSSRKEKRRLRKANRKQRRKDMTLGRSYKSTVSMSDLKESPYAVVFEQETYQKIMYWVMKTDKECSGLGLVKREGDIFRIADAFLLPQQNTGATSDIEPEDLAKAEAEHINSEVGELRFWWHSHADMSVFWSGTDTDTIHQLGEHGWFINTVFNRKAESRTAIYGGTPFKFFYDEVPTNNQTNMSDDLQTHCDVEFKKHITDLIKTPEPIKSYWETCLDTNNNYEQCGSCFYFKLKVTRFTSGVSNICNKCCDHFDKYAEDWRTKGKKGGPQLPVFIIAPCLNTFLRDNDDNYDEASDTAFDQDDEYDDSKTIYMGQ